MLPPARLVYPSKGIFKCVDLDQILLIGRQPELGDRWIEKVKEVFDGRNIPWDLAKPNCYVTPGIATAVSRYHALLKGGIVPATKEECYFVHDLHSRYGTYVNGERIQSKDLKPGDLITLGIKPTELTFRFEYR